MNEHFIKEIEIKNYKLFKDFKAEGFGRVNLIGGRNNVGKTAFMEACYLSQSKNIKILFQKLLVIQTHRNIINNLLSNTTREEDIRLLIKNNLGIEILVKGQGGRVLEDEYNDFTEWDDGLIKLQLNNNDMIDIFTQHTKINIFPSDFDEETGEEIYHSLPTSYKFADLINVIDVAFNSTKVQFSIRFLSPYSNSNQELEDIIGQSKLDNKYDELNKYLLATFGIESIDIIKNKPMLKDGNKYKELSYYGQGIKTFINLISSILLLKDDIIFIDEIDNGIHYTNLDKLWEIILTVSKEQSVQVFATTHSKECIESFNRVQLKLEDKDSFYFEMAKNIKTNEIFISPSDAQQLEYELRNNERIRGE